MPDYSRTKHIPYFANAKRDDLIASEGEARIIFDSETVDVTEKVDGASCRMALINGQPIIGGRNHIFDKSYSSTKQRNASKAQFASVWNWWYNHKEYFELLEAAGPYSVYGEWMYMAHGMIYDSLPSLFIAYDLYDYEQEIYVNTREARKILSYCGFTILPLLWYGPVRSYEELLGLCNERSSYTNQSREGVYIKVSDGDKVTERFKMVRKDFVQGALLDQTKITRNLVNN